MFKNASIMEIVTVSAVAIVIAMMFKLNGDNRKLSAENGRLEEQAAELNTKNDGMAKSLQTLTSEMQSMNKLASDEARRRAAAEMKQQKLQEEVKDALKNNKCSFELIPDGAVIGLRKAADSARGSDSKASADTSQSAN